MHFRLKDSKGGTLGRHGISAMQGPAIAVRYL